MRKLKLAVCAAMCAVILAACTASTTTTPVSAASTDTFTPTVQEQQDRYCNAGNCYYSFYVDNATGVEYIVYKSMVYGGYSVSITPRLDRNGKPVIHK